MAKKDTVHPWQQIEEQAFHAFREWPLWLVLRERELAGRITQPSPNQASTATASAESEQPQSN